MLMDGQITYGYNMLFMVSAAYGAREFRCSAPEPSVAPAFWGRFRVVVGSSKCNGSKVEDLAKY
eukprot:6208190-Lingulodinium_polyedra.AAC.1